MRIAATAIIVAIAVSFARAQEFPPKHQMLSHSVTAAGHGVYAIVATAIHFNKVKKYEILNHGDEIVLLRLREQRGKITEVRSFFRKSGSDRIIALTLKNLKKEFPSETGFHQKLDVLAKNNSQLIKYQYCINRIYRNTAQ